MINSKKIKRFVEPLTSIALVVLVALTAMAYFGDSISTKTFGAVAFVTATAILILAYFGWVAIRLGLLFAAISGILLLAVVFGDVTNKPAVDNKKYQAVFFTNGQVYFGHLKNAESKNAVLKDVYFLQTTAPQNAQNGSSAPTTPQTLAVTKLESSVHGPENEMTIKSDQILFWENLRDDGKVVQLIKADQKKK